MGQTKIVQVEKIVISNTIEDRIMELCDKKKQLADGALDGKQIANARLDLKDLMRLFRDA